MLVYSPPSWGPWEGTGSPRAELKRLPEKAGCQPHPYLHWRFVRNIAWGFRSLRLPKRWYSWRTMYFQVYNKQSEKFSSCINYNNVIDSLCIILGVYIHMNIHMQIYMCTVYVFRFYINTFTFWALVLIVYIILTSATNLWFIHCFLSLYIRQL